MNIEKKKIGNIGGVFLLLVAGVFAVALIAVISCSLEGSNDDETEEIAAPTIEVMQHTGNYVTISVTSAPIQNKSFLATITYANIFRQKAESDTGSNAEVWENIGQVERTDKTTLFTAFNFIDYYVESDGPSSYYRYCIRYYNGSKYITSAASEYKSPMHESNSTTMLSVLGKATVTTEDDEPPIKLLYERNDDTSIYTLTLETPLFVDKEPLTYGLLEKNLLQYIYVVFDNGSVARPIKLGEVILYDDSTADSGDDSNAGEGDSGDTSDDDDEDADDDSNAGSSGDDDGGDSNGDKGGDSGTDSGGGDSGETSGDDSETMSGVANAVNARADSGVASGTKSAALREAKIDLQRNMPQNFFDTPLTCKGIIAAYPTIDSGFTKYYWSSPAETYLKWETYSDNNSSTNGTPDFVKDDGIITVPTITYPNITFDDSPLSRAAAGSVSAIATPGSATLDISGL